MDTDNKYSARVSDKLYCVISKESKEDPWESEQTCLNYSEALDVYNKNKRDGFYHIELVEKIVIINTIKEEYNDITSNDYRPEK
jgi:Fe-S cluster biosynthesis and repair protein YggX